MGIAELAAKQLEAYNAADLDGFCECYHSDVLVLDGESEVVRGADGFRERYRAMFAAGGFGGTVPERMTMGSHCIDRELWWKNTPEGRREGEVLVRYTERDGLIGTVQFLR